MPAGPWYRAIPWRWRRFLVAALLVAAASALRVWPLQALGSTLVWLTFYPAVMIAALYGGLAAGLLATGLAGGTAVYLGPLLVGHPFISRPADWLGLSVFVVTGTMISAVAEAMLRANARALRAQQQAEAASRAKSVFLASMSHELRTPLNAILGFSNLLRGDAGLSDDQRETLDIINRSGASLLRLINDVLDMAKIEAGKLTVENAPLDLGELVREVLDLMRGRAESKGLRLLLDQGSSFPRFVLADAAKLRQSLVNLIGNAVKFTPQGTVTLRLRARPDAAPQRQLLVIEVEDSGAGISAADQERIFEPFVQVGDSPGQRGTGLGLSITRTFVELMGGRISVESAPGQGAKFVVELPVERLEEPAGAWDRLERGRVVGLAPGQPECRILVVEDEVENQLLLRRILEGAGLQVRVAGNGALGIEAFVSWRPHFIWMDIRMGVMDGLEATRRIRALEGGREVKIVALTASVFKEEISAILASGMDGVVHKPYRPREIFDALTRHLGVVFLREDAPGPAAPAKIADLDPQALAALPDGLRQELADALVCLDVPRIAGVIARIGGADPALGEALEQHAKLCHYTDMLKALPVPGGRP